MVSIGSLVLSNAMILAVKRSPVASSLFISSLAGEKSLPKTSCAGRWAVKHEFMSTSQEREERSTILPITTSFTPHYTNFDHDNEERLPRSSKWMLSLLYLSLSSVTSDLYSNVKVSCAY